MKKNYTRYDLTVITLNKKARHQYYISEEIEVGLSLLGWEVKALRSGKVNISDSYILLQDGEAYLFRATITPLNVASLHIDCNPMRIRKLLLKQHELNSLFITLNRKGYTAVMLSMYWKHAWCKGIIGIARGKKEHDKRYDIKNREWKRDQARIIKNTRN